MNWKEIQLMNFLSKRQNDKDVEVFKVFLDNVLYSNTVCQDIKLFDESFVETVRNNLIAAVNKRDYKEAAIFSAELYLYYSGKKPGDIYDSLVNLRQSKGCDYGNSFRVMGINKLWAVVDGKMCRLANLTRKNNKPKHEPITDTYMDILVYMGLVYICNNSPLYEETYHNKFGLVRKYLWSKRTANIKL